MNTGCVSQNLAPSVFSPSMYLQAHHRFSQKLLLSRQPLVVPPLSRIKHVGLNAGVN